MCSVNLIYLLFSVSFIKFANNSYISGQTNAIITEKLLNFKSIKIGQILTGYIRQVFAEPVIIIIKTNSSQPP